MAEPIMINGEVVDPGETLDQIEETLPQEEDSEEEVPEEQDLEEEAEEDYEEPDPDEETETHEVSKEGKDKDAVQKRFDQLTREKHEEREAREKAERREAELAKRLEELSSKVESLSKKSTEEKEKPQWSREDVLSVKQRALKGEYETDQENRDALVWADNKLQEIYKEEVKAELKAEREQSEAADKQREFQEQIAKSQLESFNAAVEDFSVLEEVAIRDEEGNLIKDDKGLARMNRESELVKAANQLLFSNSSSDPKKLDYDSLLLQRTSQPVYYAMVMALGYRELNKALGNIKENSKEINLTKKQLSQEKAKNQMMGEGGPPMEDLSATKKLETLRDAAFGKSFDSHEFQAYLKASQKAKQ